MISKIKLISGIVAAMAIATKSAGIGHGGHRSGAGRPKGAKTKTYRPHVEKLAAAGGILPKDVMLTAMRRHFRAKRYDDAAKIAAMVAPFIHPRLSCSNLTMQLSLGELIAQATDEELAAFIAEAEAAAGIGDAASAANVAPGGLAAAKPKGSA